jgi:glyoxylase-like metal-dependent hydrolase (beta-lactamase superfamily II)
VIKKVFLGIAVLIGAFILVSIAYFLPLLTKVGGFNAPATGLIAPDLYAINDKHVALFLRKSGDELIAFDAGNKIENIVAGFKELGLDPLKVKAVFLTHSDEDHTTALPLFKNATVYLPEKEEPVVTGKQKRRFFVFSGANTLPVSQYTLVADGQEIRIGKDLVKAILTPGHTIGSTSYLLNGKYLFTGDLALIENGKLIPMPKPPSEDPKTLLESLKKVEAMKVEMILTSHTGILKR